MFRQAMLPTQVIVAAIALTACANPFQKQDGNREAQLASHTYPKEIVQDFTRGCKENTPKEIKPDLAEKICTCAIGQIQQKYTLGEFRDLGEQLRKTGTPPNEIRDTIKGCAEKSLPKK
jgi:hypothetical protein